MKSRTLTLIPNEARGLFNAAAEPTLEVLTGKDSFNQAIAAGAQAADLLDGDRDGRLTVNTNGVATVFHLDVALDRRLRVDRVILDGHTLRKAYGDDVGNLVKVLYNSTDNYGTATEAAIARVQSRLLAHGPAYLDFNGVTNLVQVADDDAIGLYRRDFSLIVELEPKIVDGTYREIICKGQAAEPTIQLCITPDNKYQFSYSTTGEGSSIAKSDSVAVAGERVHLTGVADRDGNTILYVNAEPQSTTGTGHDGNLNNTEPLNLGKGTTSLYFGGKLYSAMIYNRAMSASEVLGLYNGGEVAEADKGGSQVDLMDAGAGSFESGTYSWVALDANTIANPDPPKELQITYVDNASGARLYLRDSADLTKDPVVGKRYYVLLYAKYSGGAAGSKIRINDGSNDYFSPELTTSYIMYVIDFICQSATEAQILCNSMSAGNVVHIDNILVIQSGCIGAWLPEGISPTHGKWHDRSGNNLHGAITGAEARDVPSGDEGEVLLIELEDEIDARYWYLKVNPGGLTGDANTLFGQMPLGRAAALSGVREFDEDLGYPGIDVMEAYGGSELPSVRYEGERREWPLHLVAQGDDFRDGIYRTYKAAKGAKKVPLYLVEDITLNDGRPERLIYCVKFDAPLRRKRTGKYHEIETALREVAG